MSNSDLAAVAHLMRRAGFGADRDELESLSGKPYEEIVEDLAPPGAARRPGGRRAHALQHGAVLPRRRPALGGALGVADGQLPPPAGGEDGAVLAPRLRHRVVQERTQPDHHRADRNVPRSRHDRPANHPARARQRPGDELLARQLREPRRPAQRELGARAARAVQHGRGQLHRRRHQKRRPRLHRLDVHPADSAVPVRTLRIRIPLPARRPRRQRKDVPRTLRARSTARTS